nr:hypothetical protein [Tanacetum cinerariifolium]
VSSEEGFVPHVPREIGLGVDVEDSYEPYTKPDIDPNVQADIDACIAFVDNIAARRMDVRVEVGTAVEEEAESSARGTIEIEVDLVTHPIVLDDMTEPVREDYPDLVSSEEGFVPHVPREIGLGVDVEDSYEPYTKPDIDPNVQADIDACIAVEVGTAVEEEAESSARGTIEIEVDLVTHPVFLDDMTEPVREDYPDLVSANGSLCHTPK